MPCMQDPDTNVTVGFVLPEVTAGASELSFLGLLSFPLPYGYAGVSLGEVKSSARP